MPALWSLPHNLAKEKIVQSKSEYNWSADSVNHHKIPIGHGWIYLDENEIKAVKEFQIPEPEKLTFVVHDDEVAEHCKMETWGHGARAYHITGPVLDRLKTEVNRLQDEPNSSEIKVGDMVRISGYENMGMFRVLKIDNRYINDRIISSTRDWLVTIDIGKYSKRYYMSDLKKA